MSIDLVMVVFKDNESYQPSNAMSGSFLGKLNLAQAIEIETRQAMITKLYGV